MPLADDLLKILCCPETRQDVRQMTAGEVETLNRWIQATDRQYRDGSSIELPVTEALVTADGSRCYCVIDGIPVMLIDRIIDLEEGWQSL